MNYDDFYCDKCETAFPVGGRCKCPEPTSVDSSWMIEMTKAPAPLWFKGTINQGADFTTDANKAVRYPTKEAAATMLEILMNMKKTILGRDCYAITEHKWSR